MTVNMTPVIFWALGGLIGYLCDNWHGALIGLTATLGISFLASMVSK